MDQFDKLVKEKAEKREFKYKPLFWLLFAKQAGFVAFSAVQIASGVLIVGGIISGSVFLTYKLVTKNSSPKSIEQPYNQVKSADTTLQITPDLMNQKDTIIPDNSVVISPQDHPQQTTSIQQTQVTTSNSSPIKKDTVTIQKVKTSNPYAGRRILTIDPDTILTND